MTDFPPVLEIRREAAAAPVFSPAQVQEILARLRAALPGTKFTEAWSARLPGFIAVRLENGEVAYADKFARYLILGLVFDTAAGSALDRQLEGRP